MSELTDQQSSRLHHLEMSDLMLESGPSDPYQYRMGMTNASKAAMLSAYLDPVDPEVPRQLARLAKFAVATATSMATANGEHNSITIDGTRHPIVGGLPVGALTSSKFSSALWAATAVGDAASAVFLSGFDRSLIVADSPPDQLLTAEVLSALWIAPERAPQALIAALEATDTAEVSASEADRLLLVSVPVLRMLNEIMSGSFEAASALMPQAIDDHLEYSEATSPVVPDVLSFPLTGMATLLRNVGMPPSDGGAVVPSTVAASASDRVAGCPRCASPVDPAAAVCWRCETDLQSDALIEYPRYTFAASWKRCPNCAASNFEYAFSCWSCRTDI